MKIRALIVDDEALARARMRKLLAQEPDMEVLEDCANGPEAIAAIQKLHPDLVFLDVQMPEVSGFDVLRALSPEQVPLVIFITAHDQHAIEAFEVRALDYLLKPFTQVRLHEAISRARQQLETRQTASLQDRLAELLQASPAVPLLNRIAVRTGAQVVFVRVEEIDYLESASNYVVLHTATGNHVLRETLQNLESRLSPKLFMRISRSTIVNLQRIKSCQAGAEGDHVLVLQDGHQLSMTRAVREVQERLQYS
jgi:two-component system, LytTR family, response regulator